MSETTTTTYDFPGDKPTLFESVYCTRCGGSGNYSWNAMTGSRCFKCNGRGRTMTKRGAAAHEHYRELLSKRTSDLQPGDKIMDTGVPSMLAGGWRKVLSVTNAAEAAARGERHSCPLLRASDVDKILEAAERGATILPATYKRDGEAFVEVYEGFNVECEEYSLSGVAADKLHRVASTRDEKRAARELALAFQETLTKAGKPRKTTGRSR